MKVTKAFDYTHDGYTMKSLRVGDDASDVPADQIPGLRAEGFIDGGAPERKVIEAAPETGEPVPLEKAADPYPDLTPAQEKALDRDGDGKPGGAPKGGNKKKSTARKRK